MTPNAHLLVSDNHGQYIPQQFVRHFLEYITNSFLLVQPNGDFIPTSIFSDLEVVDKGPEQEWYWDAWNNVLDKVRLYYKGTTYHLYQDGDLWAIPVNELNLISDGI